MRACKYTNAIYFSVSPITIREFMEYKRVNYDAQRRYLPTAKMMLPLIEILPLSRHRLNAYLMMISAASIFPPQFTSYMSTALKSANNTALCQRSRNAAEDDYCSHRILL